MPRPLGPIPDPPAGGALVPHELDLEGLTAGSYFTVAGHVFMAATMNLLTTAKAPKLRGEGPVRDWDEIDLRLVHAWWKCCDD